MRRIYPNAERPFRCPWVPVVPIMGVLCCLMLMFSLPTENWLRLFIWMAIGLVIYFTYGRTHSVMAKHLAREIAEHGAGGAYQSGTREA
jgi:basic amino acid/polyamine antiporter, APA family